MVTGSNPEQEKEDGAEGPVKVIRVGDLRGQ